MCECRSIALVSVGAFAGEAQGKLWECWGLGFGRGPCFTGKLNFDALMAMKKLHNCVKETLRMYPPLILLMRHVEQAVEYKVLPMFPQVLLSTACVQPRLGGVQ